MKKIIGKILLTSILFLIIAQIVHSLGAMATMNYYMLEEFFPVWSSIMMPNEGPPGTSFFLLSAVFNFLTGLIFSVVYLTVNKGLKPKKATKKGLLYGFLVFSVATIPGTLSMILLINLPLMLILGWAIEGLIIFLAAGWIVGKLLTKP